MTFLPPRFLALLGLALWLQACESGTVSMEQIAKFSPRMVETNEDPWQTAQRIAASVPNSRFVVGHGDGMMPLYAHGTVLVLQKLTWNHLEPGMTVVYGANPYSPFALVCQVIEEQTPNGSWTGRSLASEEPSPVPVTEDNYIGTVVAALRRSDGAPPKTLPGTLAQTADAYCLLRCHVGGVIHPNLPPSLTPAPGVVAWNHGRPPPSVAKLLARMLPDARP